MYRGFLMRHGLGGLAEKGHGYWKGDCFSQENIKEFSKNRRGGGVLNFRPVFAMGVHL